MFKEKLTFGVDLTRAQHRQKLGEVINYPYKEYDADGNCIYKENSYAEWTVYEYDASGKETKRYDYDGRSYETIRSIDEETGDKIRVRITNGTIKTTEHKNNKGRVTKYIDTSGIIKTWKYDERGRTIYESVDDKWWKYEFDGDGNIIHQERYDGYWERKEYNWRGSLVRSEDSKGFIETNEYDSCGRHLSMNHNDGYYIRYAYDENGKTLLDYDDGKLEIKMKIGLEEYEQIKEILGL